MPLVHQGAKPHLRENQAYQVRTQGVPLPQAIKVDHLHRSPTLKEANLIDTCALVQERQPSIKWILKSAIDMKMNHHKEIIMWITKIGNDYADKVDHLALIQEMLLIDMRIKVIHNKMKKLSRNDSIMSKVVIAIVMLTMMVLLHQGATRVHLQGVRNVVHQGMKSMHLLHQGATRVHLQGVRNVVHQGMKSLHPPSKTRQRLCSTSSAS